MIQPLRRRFYRTRNGRKIYEIVKQRTRKSAKKDWERVDVISLSRVFHVGHKYHSNDCDHGTDQKNELAKVVLYFEEYLDVNICILVTSS